MNVSLAAISYLNLVPISLHTAVMSVREDLMMGKSDWVTLHVPYIVSSVCRSYT